MLPTSAIPLVLTTISVVDVIHHRATILDFIFPCESPAPKEQAIAGNGGHIVLLVCIKQNREPLHLQQVRCRFSNRRIYRWSSWKCLLPEDGWHSLYVHGDRRLVFGTCKSALQKYFIGLGLIGSDDVSSRACLKLVELLRMATESTSEAR